MRIRFRASGFGQVAKINIIRAKSKQASCAEMVLESFVFWLVWGPVKTTLKSSEKYLKTTKSILLFDKKCSLGTYKRCKNYLKYDLKQPKNGRKSAVQSRKSQIQPNTRTAQCARCIFMFLLAVLSHNQINFQIK